MQIPIEHAPEVLPALPQGKLPRVLVWFRRDLRLEDNPALTTALEIAEEVVRFQGPSFPSLLPRHLIQAPSHHTDPNLRLCPRRRGPIPARSLLAVVAGCLPHIPRRPAPLPRLSSPPFQSHRI